MIPQEDESQGAKSLRQLALDRTKSLAQAGEVSYAMILDLPWPVQKDLWDKPSSREQRLKSQIARLASFLQHTDLGPQCTGQLPYKMLSELPVHSQKCAWHMLIEREHRLEQRLARLAKDVPLIDREALFEIDPNQSFIDRYPESLIQDNSTALSCQADRSEWQRLIGQLHFSLQAHEVVHGQVKLGIQYDRRIRYKSARLVKNSEDSTFRWGLCVDESCNHGEHFALNELISPSLFNSRMGTFLQGYFHRPRTGVKPLSGWITFGPFGTTLKKDSVSYMIVATIDRQSNWVAELCINVLLSPVEDVLDGPSLCRSSMETQALALESRRMSFARRYESAVQALVKETEVEREAERERELLCSRRARTFGNKKSSRPWLRL
jgi:hypothetical protein